MKIMKKMPWFILILHLCLIIYVVRTFQVDDVTLHKGKIDSFDTGWTLIREDGSETGIELPYYEECDANQVIRIKNQLPKEYCGKTLSFLTADKNMRIFIDGNVVYEFGVNDKRSFGKTPGSVTNFIDIPRDFSQGEILIELWSPYDNYGASIDSMIIAERHIAILDMLKENTLQFTCVLLLLGFSLVFAVFAGSSKWMRQSTDGTEYLAIYCLLACVYYAIETKAMNIIYGNQTLYSVSVFLLLMLLPIFMLAYYIHRFSLEKQKSIFVIMLLALVNGCVQLPLQILNIKDFMDMAVLSHGIMFVSIWILLWNLFMVLKREAKSGYKLEYAALISVGVCGLVDIIRSYTETTEHIEKYSRYGTTVFCFFMMLSHIIQLIRKYAAALEENAKLLEQKVELAERKNEAKSIFLARMSHEIRTPINAVLGMNQMILKETKESMTHAYAEDVDSAAQTLLGIVNEILDLSKIEAGKMELVETEYSFANMLSEVSNMIAIRAQSKNLRFRLRIDKTIPAILRGDELKLRQILTNILSNAVKYTNEGSVTLSITGRRRDNGKELELSCRVADTGIGIKEEDLPKLFNAFERFEEEKNRVVEGTGLGMNITMQFLKLMGSKLEVESEYELGSTFYFTVVQTIADDEPIGDFEEQFRMRREKYLNKNQETGTSELINKKILLVDDNKLNRKVFKSLLKDTGIQVTEANSGEECLLASQQKKFEVIFLDHMMPGMNGVETLHAMREMNDNPNSETPVIALTATDMTNPEGFYKKEGFDGYLAKPIEPDKLMRILLSI